MFYNPKRKVEFSGIHWTRGNHSKSKDQLGSVESTELGKVCKSIQKWSSMESTDLEKRQNINIESGKVFRIHWHIEFSGIHWTREIILILKRKSSSVQFIELGGSFKSERKNRVQWNPLNSEKYSKLNQNSSSVEPTELDEPENININRTGKSIQTQTKSWVRWNPLNSWK